MTCGLDGLERKSRFKLTFIFTRETNILYILCGIIYCRPDGELIVPQVSEFVPHGVQMLALEVHVGEAVVGPETGKRRKELWNLAML